ncbi:LPXTG cell wall anchor domain-containing protein [Jiangella alkaliphila]|uniref:LPXTG-motif cell wall anchor domain-containing protein n=1 Tax=Jiangella alkaliphila TaxID=419479 RepID=A0A1H2KSN9_9ACTN|nr:LPXTG cell wall anchor domain-containing protein [Jiangella alkaliphila]SDU71643.1 LPXTG-motif cell wall anchor domain-containing protein [Jiangella alkaliphila]
MIGATAVALTAPAAAEEQPVDVAVSAIPQVFGPPGATLEVNAGFSNMGGQDMDGWTTDFTVPDGVTITGIVDGEILDGTDRPDEGCALITPQRLECHSNATVAIADSVDTRFEVTLDDDASDELGVATFSVTADEGGTGSAETAITAIADEVVIEAALDPGDYEGAPGTTFEQTARVTNTGAVDMVGYSLDFFAGGLVAITGITGLDLVDGTARPDEGCVLVDIGRTECHTGATLAAGDSTEVTFQLRLPERAEFASLGDTHVHVFGDNGGDFSDVAEVGLAIDPTKLLVFSAPTSMSIPAGRTVAGVEFKADNVGAVYAAARRTVLEVPDGVTIVDVLGYDVVDEITPPESGCVLETPRRAACYRDVIETGNGDIMQFELRLDADLPVGELGVATLTSTGHGGEYDGEILMSIYDLGDDGGATGADDDGGDGEELPDTGTSSTTVALAALGLMLAGAAAMTLRARRA